jgi:hypothetical protein
MRRWPASTTSSCPSRICPEAWSGTAACSASSSSTSSPTRRTASSGASRAVRGLGDTGFALRENPESARGFRGFDPVCFGIADHAAAQAWAAKLDDLGVEHSPIIEATIGWMVSFHDPDGTEIRLYSWAGPEQDHTGQPDYAHMRPVSPQS